MTQINRLTNPIDYIINCCEQGLVPDKFDILNAKDELQKLRKCSNSIYDMIAWGRINYRGDLYDLRMTHNPYVDQNTVLPLYSNREEFKNLMSQLKKT